MIELTAGQARVLIDPGAGGRLRQLSVAGLDLLVADGEGLYDWGLFPMVPFAGRIGHGRFSFAGRVHQLPLGMPPHAIHGTLLDVAWEARFADDRTAQLATTLDHPWPFNGEASHTVRLEPDGLRLVLTVRAVDAMPVTVGWHPWWRRHLGRGGSATLTFGAGAMYRRDGEGIPTGSLVRPPPPGPWDDCFTELSASPVLGWSGALEITMEHTCDHLVVYDEPRDALCVEPQTGPPDAVNLGQATVVEAGGSLQAQLVLRWRRASPPA